MSADRAWGIGTTERLFGVRRLGSVCPTVTSLISTWGESTARPDPLMAGRVDHSQASEVPELRPQGLVGTDEWLVAI